MIDSSRCHRRKRRALDHLAFNDRVAFQLVQNAMCRAAAHAESTGDLQTIKPVAAALEEQPTDSQNCQRAVEIRHVSLTQVSRLRRPSRDGPDSKSRIRRS